jgi:hypothetical protein
VIECDGKRSVDLIGQSLQYLRAKPMLIVAVPTQSKAEQCNSLHPADQGWLSPSPSQNSCRPAQQWSYLLDTLEAIPLLVRVAIGHRQPCKSPHSGDVSHITIDIIGYNMSQMPNVRGQTRSNRPAPNGSLLTLGFVQRFGSIIFA